MHRDKIAATPLSKKKAVTVALIGNPNCGKSTVFNQLTGLRQKVGNFPGVTVDKKVGTFFLETGTEIQLIDFPGTYSLYPTSQDERVVLNTLTNPQDALYPDCIVYVADSTNLEKHLLLFTQIKDLGFPCLLALNMADEARKENIIYDTAALKKALGVSVIAISARDGENFPQLKKSLAILTQTVINTPQIFYKLSAEEKATANTIQHQLSLNNPYQALLIAQNAERLPFLDQEQRATINETLVRNDFNRLGMQVREVMQRFDTFTPILKKSIERSSNNKRNWTDRIDDIVTHRIWGPLVFFGLMVLVFQAIYAWSSYPMDLIDAGFANLSDGVKTLLPAAWYTDLLTDGILAGLGGILIFIPQIAILFLLIALLEEVGYMARAVFMFDNPQ